MNKGFPGRALSIAQNAEDFQVEKLIGFLDWDADFRMQVEATATALIKRVRNVPAKFGEIEALLLKYPLSSPEGLGLMTLAESLLRIPDSGTANALIKEKLVHGNWNKADDKAENDGDETPQKKQDLVLRLLAEGLNISSKTYKSPLGKVSRPFLLQAFKRSMRQMGQSFVLGETIEKALKKSKPYQKNSILFSYDMLGEAARTQEQSAKFMASYLHAIQTIGEAAKNDPCDDITQRPGISVKLSALYPKYHTVYAKDCVPILTERLRQLCGEAKAQNINLTVDAEEVERLDISIDIIDAILDDKDLVDWQGFGLALQAYQRSAVDLLDYLHRRAVETKRKLQIRLVKGAYWDTEIKRAQAMGLDDYPVFTKKSHTDISFLACAKKMLAMDSHFYPMFATHNAQTIASIIQMAERSEVRFEFQRLHGMGDAVYDVVNGDDMGRVRVYAPVGAHEELLPYLVRRILENGANSSFVQQIRDDAVPISWLSKDPISHALNDNERNILPPSDIYGDARVNSAGYDMSDKATLAGFIQGAEATKDASALHASSVLDGAPYNAGYPETVANPSNHDDIVGTAMFASAEVAAPAFKAAQKGYKIWRKTDAARRADILCRIADLYEQNKDHLVGLMMREAGKTLEDALAELREAVDFCRYYAAHGRRIFRKEGMLLPGPTGEENRLFMEGRGVFVCISPWNFPFAIFTGQVVAALMAGNAVIAKPAEQTPIIAFEATKLMFEAGVPHGALQLVVGDGAVGAALVEHPFCGGVSFTGSNATAFKINRTLAAKNGPFVPFIAETGGLNTMIVDSTALPEQVVDDVIISAFGSAGQRCSALRLLLLQDDIAPRILPMLKGAMADLTVGNPLNIHTDIGPLIDAEAHEMLTRHREVMNGVGEILATAPLDDDVAQKGYYFAPTLCRLKEFDDLEQEVFGPFLHVMTFKADELEDLIGKINDTGYGLTFGLHSRLEERHEMLSDLIDVGNIYINRHMTGAVVGSQPFGGHGLSGTGPKAGGPHYLYRFASEKAISTNTAAMGGDVRLLVE
ncbi:MAG: bifunctional proline dehydrogenase/L-glutamate gamma-semialdehyde dehydrogenase [Alphaproteobacteria bacterium]|nr:bifunctional proline dehydrogenase/L-glutamate gamma-semialdehyde dehydrogenase [Alphaproteobacteria bacterium]|tara:strand:- start:783775 stop:786885 length:3111 start_codon:yes stop_codon:yes gene_type:complete